LSYFGDAVIADMQRVITSEDANKVSRLKAASVYWWLKAETSHDCLPLQKPREIQATAKPEMHSPGLPRRW
jgi:hypothetical protein